MASLLSTTLNTRFVREGSYRYIRSDVPDKLNEDDIAWLLEHNVRTIVDLRAPQEAAKRPCPLATHPAFTYHSIPVSTGDSYMAMADDTMEQIIRLVEAAPTNVMYFCNAGKDRTGVLSALLLQRMGASRQEIVDNYLITAENLREMLAAFVAQRPELSLSVVTPRAWYMETFLDRYNARNSTC